MAAHDTLARTGGTRTGGLLRTTLRRRRHDRSGEFLACLGSFGDDFFGDDVPDD
jgi:hypothetical protein